MSARARISLAPAWVLRASPYRDTSLLVEALTRDQGRIGLVARGARGSRRGLRERLQSFRPLLLSWSERGDLGTLEAAESAGPAPELPGEQVFSGWYLNELLLRLLQRHDAHPDIFDAYSATLAALNSQGECVLRYFELELLAGLGFGLDWPEPIEAGAWYRLSPEAATQRLAEPLPGAFAAGTLAALQERRLQSDDELREARRLMRAMLAPQLGERPLESALMLRRLRRGG